MRALGKLFFLVIVLAVALFFYSNWRNDTPFGVGTGNIAGSGQGTVARSSGAGDGGTISAIARNPASFEGKRVWVSGRVRGAAKYASNRNIYMLIDNDDKLLVIDDKSAPRDLWKRKISGIVHVIGPPIGGLNYPYLVSVHEGAKFDEPRWQDIAHFFTDKYNDVKSGIKDQLNK